MASGLGLASHSVGQQVLHLALRLGLGRLCSVIERMLHVHSGSSAYRLTDSPAHSFDTFARKLQEDGNRSS